MTRPRLLTELTFWLSLIAILGSGACAIGYLVTCIVDWLL